MFKDIEEGQTRFCTACEESAHGMELTELHSCRMTQTNEERVEYVASVCDEVEFLHGVPVKLPSHTKALLRGRIREALEANTADTLARVREIVPKEQPLIHDVNWAEGYNACRKTFLKTLTPLSLESAGERYSATNNKYPLTNPYSLTSDKQESKVTVGYKLAVKHLKEAYEANHGTTCAEAIEWLKDNAKYVTESDKTEVNG